MEYTDLMKFTDTQLETIYTVTKLEQNNQITYGLYTDGMYEEKGNGYYIIENAQTFGEVSKALFEAVADHRGIERSEMPDCITDLEDFIEV